jgi:uncharacterized protein YwqG
VRPLEDLDGLAVQPGGDLILTAHGSGQFALLDGRSGRTVTICGERQWTQDVAFALSACGEFVVYARHDRVIVMEIATDREVWQRAGTVRWIRPIGDGTLWALVKSQELEIWRWPFGEAPERSIPLSSFCFRPAVNEERFALDTCNPIPVHRIADARQLFSVPGDTLAKPYFLSDGSLVVASTGALSLYDVGGTRTAHVSAPTLTGYAHAFSPARDDAVFSYHDGIALVRGFREQLQHATELTPPWPEPKARDSAHQGIDHFYRPDMPASFVAPSATTPEDLARELAEFSRPAWKPVLYAGAGSVEGSKFGGTAWLSEQEEWPRCGQCGSHMDLFLQLNSKELPAGCPPLFEGLLQVFVCTRETYRDGMCDHAEPFSSAARVRICKPAGAARYRQPPFADAFEEERIVGWERRDDLPLFVELELHGVQLDDDQQTMQIDREFDFPIAGDKLLGWADWIQGPSLVRCSECNGAMRVLFQIDARKGVPIMLGDGGVAWVHQCPQHTHVVALAWDCG